MLSFLLLAMPLAAIAYAFGGVTTDALTFGLYALLLSCLQVGALALMCSAWCRSTVSALLSTYLLAVMFYAGPPILAKLLSLFIPGSYWWKEDFNVTLLIPPALWQEAQNSRAGWGVTPTSWSTVERRSVLILISIVTLLSLTRVFLVRRAFAPPSSFFLRLFRKLDGLMQRANRITGHRMLLREGRSLPDDDPIAWREMTRKALGKVHYLVRILVAIEVPVIALCALASLDLDNYRGQCEMLSLVAMVVGTLAILALSVQAANTIVAERVQQTLEVLLTTSLTAREIVAQKARVLRRFMLVLAVPLLTIFGAEVFLEWGVTPRQGFGERDGSLIYIVCSLLTVGIYLPLVSWLSLWIGLKMRTRFKAILTALAVIVAWCAVPIIGVIFLGSMGRFDWLTRQVFTGVLAILSPIVVPAFNEQSRLTLFPPFDRSQGQIFGAAWIVIAINFTFYGGLLLLFRHLALSRADRYLRR